MKRMKIKNEDWDYIIDDKKYGIMRIFIVCILFAFFAALTVDQLMQGVSKKVILMISFGCISVILLVTLIRIVNRFIYYKVLIGEEGFFFQCNPFNGKYYEYKNIKSCKQSLITVRHNVGSGFGGISYHYFFEFTDNRGKTQKILFDKSLFEREFNILTERIKLQGQ